MPGRTIRYESVLLSLSLLFLSACSALPGYAPTQSSLLPTRTLAPARTVVPYTPEPPATAHLQVLPTATLSPVGSTSTSVAGTGPNRTDTTVTPGALSITSCADVRPTPDSVIPTSANATTPGQIVFVTLNGDIALTDASGSRVQPVTHDANTNDSQRRLRIYAYPTFSHDGTELAFIQFTTISGTNIVTQTLVDAPAQAGATLTPLYTTRVDSISYPSWSPNNQYVAFLTVGPDGEALHVVGRSGGANTIVEQGSSIYWQWRADSGMLAVHVGGSTATDASAHISLVAPTSLTTTRLTSVPGYFKAPDYSPDAKYLLFVARIQGNDNLILADTLGKPLCSLSQLDAGASFAWSPDGHRVAWINSADAIDNPASLYVYDLRTGIQSKLHDSAAGFFWSPDSNNLAVYSFVLSSKPTTFGHVGGVENSPATQNQTQTPLLRIEKVNVTTGDALLMADTAPSHTFFNMLGYFDQYARDLTPWSPAGTQLVLTSASQTQDSIDMAVATLGRGGTTVSLKRVGAAVVAFWSPH